MGRGLGWSHQWQTVHMLYMYLYCIVLLYLLQCKTRFILKSWHLNLGVLNSRMKRQTKAFITKLSCKICTVLRHYAAQSGNFLLMFRDNRLVPSSRVKTSKRQNKAWPKLTDAILFFGLCLWSNFLSSTAFQKPALVPLSGKDPSGPLGWVILIHWVPQKHVKISTWEQI
jgi:hypothetical protein